MFYPLRLFSSTSRSRGDEFHERLDSTKSNNVDDGINKMESILLLLKDTQALPLGSMTPDQIIEAEEALECWVSASASLPRRRKQSRANHPDKYKKDYENCFENAKFLLLRLAREQRFHEEHHDISNIDKSHAVDGHKMVRSDLMDGEDGNHDGNSINDWVKKQQIDGNLSSSDDCYFVRPFLLNRVVDCWRIGWRDERLDSTPNDVMGWVEDFDIDNRTITMIINGICLRGDPFEAPLLAQWLLDRRLGQAYEDEDDTSLRPDTIFFTNVIRAWAKSGRIEAPEMADGLLKMMHELYAKSGWMESAPNAFSYAATMEAWSKSQRHPESTKRIEELLEEMKNSSLMQVVPDRVSYQYALNAWANSKSTIGAEKAYHVLQEMITLFEAGNVLVAPNASNFSRVILALARDGNDERVESLLEQLQDLYTKTGDPNLRPTDECWKACIIAKAKTGGVAEAQGMLDELVERALSGNSKMLMPRRSYFVDTLVAWTKIKDQFLAAKRSQSVLDRMMELARQDESYHNLQPDAKSFEKVILAWSRSRHHSAPERIEKLLREMERQVDLGNNAMQTSLAGYTNLMLAWQRSGRKESVNSIQQIFDKLQKRCATSGESHLRPDRYVFGILIDSWARGKNLEKVEFIFGEMMKEWKNGDRHARPDIHIFHKILKAYSEDTQYRAFAVEKCEHYFSLMEELGLPATVQTCGYLIRVMDSNSSGGENNNLHRASVVLDDLLESVRKGTTRLPSNYREYRYFLQTIANSSIPHRNLQAKRILSASSRGSGRIPKELLPPL